jgi:hypothetical protein
MMLGSLPCLVISYYLRSTIMGLDTCLSCGWKFGESLHSCPSTVISCWHRERVKLLQVVFVVGNDYFKMFDEVF